MQDENDVRNQLMLRFILKTLILDVFCETLLDDAGFLLTEF